MATSQQERRAAFDPIAFSLDGGPLAHQVGRYLPSNAGSAVVKLNPDAWDMAPWTGFALFTSYALATLAVAVAKREIAGQGG
jgi:hypothetical protein